MYIYSRMDIFWPNCGKRYVLKIEYKKNENNNIYVKNRKFYYNKCECSCLEKVSDKIYESCPKEIKKTN